MMPTCGDRGLRKSHWRSDVIIALCLVWIILYVANLLVPA